MPLLESYTKGTRIKMRPCESQLFDTSMNVQCPRDIRDEHPVGTIFYCPDLEESSGGSFYRALGGVRVATPADRIPVRAVQFEIINIAEDTMAVKKKKKAKKKTIKKKVVKKTAVPDINIYDVL